MEQYLQECLQMLQTSLKDSEIKENSIYVPSYELTITPTITKIDEKENAALAVTTFVISHSSFEETIIEKFLGTGTDISSAIMQAVTMFITSSCVAVINCIDNKSNSSIKQMLFGREINWEVFESPISTIGKTEKSRTRSYFDIIKTYLVSHLGNHKIYYIQTYASKSKDGEIACECRVNNIPSKELSQLLVDYATNFNVETNFFTQKQLILLTQKQETYKAYPYTRAEMDIITNKALKLFAACNDKLKYNNLLNELIKITKDEKLAYELRSFIPEMCAEFYFTKVNYDEKITVMKGNEKLVVFKDQFTPYYWIFNRVILAFMNNEYTEQIFKNIISMSAVFHTIQEKSKNENTVDLTKVNIKLGINVPSTYTVR